MRTQRIARSTGRTFSKRGRMNESPSKFRRVRGRCPRPTLSQFSAFRNSVILPSMVSTSNHDEFTPLTSRMAYATLPLAFVVWFSIGFGCCNFVVF